MSENDTEIKTQNTINDIRESVKNYLQKATQDDQVVFLVEYLLMRGPVNGTYVPEKEIDKVEKDSSFSFSKNVKQRVLEEYYKQKNR